MCLKAHSGISIWCLENLYIFPQSETDSMHMHMNLGELRELVLDREAWHAAIHGVTKSRTRLSDWTELNSRDRALSLHLLSLFLSFIFFFYLLSKTMGCFSGCLMSSASIQKLFCRIYSEFKCSFDEFVGEKVVSPSYSSAILGPPPHSSFLAWEIPWTEEPGRLQSMGLHRVGHDWSNLAHTLNYDEGSIGQSRGNCSKQEEQQVWRPWLRNEWCLLPL